MTGITDKLTNGIASLPDYIEPWVRELLTEARASILTLQADGRTKAATIEALDEQVEELASITEFIEARTDAPRMDDHGNLLRIVQRIGAMQAELVRVRTERDEAKDEAKAADLHRNLNRRVAGALGLLEMQTDPETGEEYLPSWHNMPEKVEALKAERAEIRVAVGLPADDPATNVIEQIRRRAAALRASRSAHSTTVGVSLRLQEMNADLTAQVGELRLTLAAEQGQQEGAPSEAWRYAQRHPSSELGWALPYPLDELPEEYRRPWAGKPTDHDPRCWVLRRDGKWLLRWRAGQRKPSFHESARAAMIAADKAIGQPVQAPDLRPSNVLLTLTPALQARVEALGYAPGETPAGVLPWLVTFAEEVRQDVALAAGELLIPIPEPGSDLSRVMIANRLLKGRAEKVERELTEAQKTLSRWENDAAYLLDHTPGAIRVREGGGPENLRASLSVTWMKLCKDATRLAEVLKPVGGFDVEQLRKRYSEGVVPPCRICGAELAPAESDWRRTVYACPGGDWSTGKWAPFVEGRTLADAHYSASRVEIPNGDPDVIALLNALLTGRAKPRPWLITETDGSTCVAATSKETAWVAYEAAIGDAIEFDDTEYHVHEVTVKDVDEMLEAASVADEEIHKAKQAARVAGMDAERSGKIVKTVCDALGNGADEDLWPPGKTLGEAVKLLAARPNFRDAFEAVNELSPPCDWLKRLRWAKTREDLEALIVDAQKESLRRVMAEVKADVCTCDNPPPYEGADGVFHVAGDCPIHGDEDDIEEEPVEGEDAP